jgi:hypothetical protein
MEFDIPKPTLDQPSVDLPRDMKVLAVAMLPISVIVWATIAPKTRKIAHHGTSRWRCFSMEKRGGEDRAIR